MACDAASLGAALAKALNCIGLLAVPHLQEADREAAFRQEARTAISEVTSCRPYVGLTTMRKELLQSSDRMEELVVLLDEGAQLDEKRLVTLARAALAALGVPEPPEGWDNYQPTPEED